MSDEKSTQAIKTFYLNDDPTLILESQEEAAIFNAELKEQVQLRLVEMAKNDTAEDPFSYEYVLARLENDILNAESKGDDVELDRLQTLLDKMLTQELLPIQVVRQAWFKKQ